MIYDIPIPYKLKYKDNPFKINSDYPEPIIIFFLSKKNNSYFIV